MTDLATGDPAAAAVPSTIIKFALKAGAGEVGVDTAKVPDPIYQEALMLGFKAIAERAMSKITKEAYPDEAQRKAAIAAKAEKNIQDMYDGKTKISGQTKSKASKTDKAVHTEAMRLARNLVKDAMKANKIKISTVKASEITRVATQYVEQNPSILETAKANLAAREAIPVTIDIKSMIHVDPALVAKEDAKKAKAKADKPLSATQAGRTVPRAKGQKPVQANA